MSSMKVLNMAGAEVGTVELSDAIFGIEPNPVVVHEVVKNHLANCRQGTQSALTRAEVSGGGRKPWRQKGTGRARSGMSSSPLWRGGGRTFPNTPDENFSQKVNKKMYRAGMASIFSKLVSDARFCVVDAMKAETPKTKDFAGQLKTLGLTERTLIIIGEEELDDNIILASRNLKDVLVVTPRYADPLCLLYFDKVVATKAAVAQIEEMLA